ncbi:helix-turn-helix domain-containing protein [Mycolicibacterium phlei]|uniref:helix-turn-helix domain-containing protein n=1 Tax=Mycolicibacterium phlei TaxID=1771 RepID=UPI000DA25C28|nr:helix-turn-helix domain-containing protein [Mycolicibacterium phlei]
MNYTVANIDMAISDLHCGQEKVTQNGTTKQCRNPRNWQDFVDALDGVDLTLTQRAVLQAHYKFADPDGRNCRASVETIAAYLSCSVSTVTKARRALRDGGWLIERSRGHNSKDENRASVFDVVIPAAVTRYPSKPQRAPRNPCGINQHTRGRRRSELHNR